jgi:hypothetical protein
VTGYDFFENQFTPWVGWYRELRSERMFLLDIADLEVKRLERMK